MKPAFLPLLCFYAFSISIGEDRNILLLISDNHTWTDVGCYGHPLIQTPNLDKLASEGIRFEHAFATTASCGPSRVLNFTISKPIRGKRKTWRTIPNSRRSGKRWWLD
jgi:N-sulfoglucosamine sulfohydrolase